MSVVSTTSEIRRRAVTETAAIVGAGWVSLPFQYSVDNNDSRSLERGYAVRYGAINQVYGEIDQVVNMEQDYEIELTKRAFIRGDDGKMHTTLDDLFDKSAAVINRFCLEKLGIPGNIQQVEFKGAPDPNFIGEGRDIASLILRFRVRYLNLLITV